MALSVGAETARDSTVQSTRTNFSFLFVPGSVQAVVFIVGGDSTQPTNKTISFHISSFTRKETDMPTFEEAKTKAEARAAILQAIKEELVERLELEIRPEDIDDDTFLFGGGLSLDSIDSMEIIIGMQSRFDVMIPEGETAPLRTINTLADFVQAEQA